MIALIIALLCAVPASAQVFPLPPLAPQHVICDSGCGSPPANPDGSTFTAGVSNVSLIGAAFDDAVADLVAGTYGSPRLTAKRALHVNLRTAAGVEIGTVAAPVFVNCSVGCAAGTPGQTTMANSSPVVIAIDQSAVAISAAALPLPAGASTSALQTTGNTSLASLASTIDSNLNLRVDLAAVGGLAVPVQQGSGVSVGAIRVELPTDGTGRVNLGAGAASIGTLGANSGVDIGDVTINNAAGAAAVNVQDGGNSLTVDGTVALAAGAAVIGHVIADAGSTTAVTGNVTVVQPTATNLNAAVVGTGTAGTPAGNILTIQGVAAMTKLLVTPDSVALPANQSVNVAQIAGTNTVTGGVAGIMAVGGNVANAVAATANPVPVGGIFTTTPATLTTGQTATMQFTAAQNLKHDLTTIAGTAPTTVGKLDVKGADGDVFVRQATAANLNATVTQLAITKGTQATTGVTTQDLHDAGRSAISFYANNFASGATTVETIITWTQSKGTGAVVAATASYTITNGKTLRITALSVGTRGHLTATAQTTTFSLRLNTAGACVVTSTPILFAAQSATAAVSLAWDRVIIPIPEGYEIAGNGTIALCITGNATFTTNAPTWAVNLIGYEY